MEILKNFFGPGIAIPLEETDEFFELSVRTKINYMNVIQL